MKITFGKIENTSPRTEWDKTIDVKLAGNAIGRLYTNYQDNKLGQCVFVSALGKWDFYAENNLQAKQLIMRKCEF